MIFILYAITITAIMASLSLLPLLHYHPTKQHHRTVIFYDDVANSHVFLSGIMHGLNLNPSLFGCSSNSSDFFLQNCNFSKSSFTNTWYGIKRLDDNGVLLHFINLCAPGKSTAQTQLKSKVQHKHMRLTNLFNY